MNAIEERDTADQAVRALGRMSKDLTKTRAERDFLRKALFDTYSKLDLIKEDKLKFLGLWTSYTTLRALTENYP